MYESLDDVVVLPRLNAELSVGAIYKVIELIPEADEIATEQPSDRVNEAQD